MLLRQYDNSLGIADTMAMQVVTAMRVGGTYLKVSIVQGGMPLDFLSNTS